MSTWVTYTGALGVPIVNALGTWTRAGERKCVPEGMERQARRLCGSGGFRLERDDTPAPDPLDLLLSYQLLPYFNNDDNSED